MKRRDFLKGILLAGVAPAFVRFDSLMVPKRIIDGNSYLITSEDGLSWNEITLQSAGLDKTAIKIRGRNHEIMVGDIIKVSGTNFMSCDGEFVVTKLENKFI